MISANKEQEAARLLNETQFSHRKIAKMVGISRGVVGAIAAGTRPDYDARRRARDEAEEEKVGPVGRCPTCGARVYLPCRLCKVRELKDQERAVLRESRRRERRARLVELLAALRREANRGDAQASRRFAG